MTNDEDRYQQILQRIRKFRDDRDWMQFHNPRNLAVSIVLEASELLEHFQWARDEEVVGYIEKNKEDVRDEIADIATYLFELADNLGIDLFEAMERKFEKNEAKYPVEKARGNAKKYTDL